MYNEGGVCNCHTRINLCDWPFRLTYPITIPICLITMAHMLESMLIFLTIHNTLHKISRSSAHFHTTTMLNPSS